MQLTTKIIPAANGNLSSLAAAINAEHRACVSTANEALHHAQAAGDLLSEAKGQCGHGEWGPYLAENFDGSARTARLYMQLAERRAELESKRQRDTVFTVSEARRLIAAPRPPVTDAAIGGFALPDLTSDAIWFAVGQGEKILQVEPIAGQRGFAYVTVLDTNDGALIETKRGVNLKTFWSLRMLESWGFVPCGEWQRVDRESAPIALIDRSVRFAAWLAMQQGTYTDPEDASTWKPNTSWGEALAAAMAAA